MNLRRTASAVLAGALALSMAVTAAAAVETEITGVSDTYGTANGTVKSAGKEYRFSGGFNQLAFLDNTHPGTEIFIPLSKKDFEWDEDKSEMPVSPATYKRLGLSLWISVDENNGVFDKLELAERDGKLGVLLDFVDSYAGVEAMEFNLDAAILVDDWELDGSRFKIEGSLSNASQTVFPYSKNVKLGVGKIAWAYDDIPSITFDLGSGVKATTSMAYRGKVYGAAGTKVKSKDKQVMEKYPAITGVYHLETVGLLSSKVRIELDATHYIYDGDLAYLGTSDSTVKMADTYYVSSKKL